MRSLGAEVIEEGRDYDESVKVAERLVAERGLFMAHSTNNPNVLAGAATITLEIVEQAAEQSRTSGQGVKRSGAAEHPIDAMVVAVGGGSQAVGALTVMRERLPDVPVYGVQAAKASAIHDSWHAGERLTRDSADTFADGLATRSTYDMTFPPLKDGLRGFVTATEAELAEAVRIYLRTTHNLVEGAGRRRPGRIAQARPRIGRQDRRGDHLGRQHRRSNPARGREQRDRLVII